jgi:hypothetical protein
MSTARERPELRAGTCDVCLKDTDVRDWMDVQSDESVTCCDPCEADLRAGWDEMTDDERAAVEAEIAEARAYTTDLIPAPHKNGKNGFDTTEAAAS